MTVVSNNRNRREHYIFNLWVVNISRDKHFEMSFELARQLVAAGTGRGATFDGR
jgi:hypothetical protein